MEDAPEGLKIFLKERSPTSWNQTLELAENYRVAHNNRGDEQHKSRPRIEGSKPDTQGSNTGHHYNRFADRMAIRQTRGDNRNRNTRGRVDNRREEVDPKIVCFKCGQPRHRASHCNVRKASTVGAVQAEGISSPATKGHQV